MLWSELVDELVEESLLPAAGLVDVLGVPAIGVTETAAVFELAGVAESVLSDVVLVDDVGVVVVLESLVDVELSALAVVTPLTPRNVKPIKTDATPTVNFLIANRCFFASCFFQLFLGVLL
nr:hypothetical protein [Limosilactobacillus viscerum]